MATKTTAATVSSLIKKELKATFPGIKFSVKSSTYSGGNSVRVGWEFGPTEKEVKAITDKYEGGHFDGMNDMYVPREADMIVDENGELMERPTVKFTFTDRTVSDEFKLEMVKDLCENLNVEYDGFRSQWYDEKVSVIARRILWNTSYKTNTPEYKGIAKLATSSGRIEDFFALVTEERTAEQLVVESYEKKVTELEKDYYVMVAERDQLRGELSNLQRQMEEEKKDRTKPTLVQPDTMFIEGVMYANLNKNNTLEEYHEEVDKGEYSSELTRVTEIVMVTDEHYELLKDNLLTAFDYMKGKGGHDSKYKLPAEYEAKNYWEWPKEEVEKFKAQMFREALLVYHPTKEMFLIDPQGYSYARYVGLIDETTQKDLREFIENM